MSSLALRLFDWLPGGAQAQPKGLLAQSSGFRLSRDETRWLLTLLVASRLILLAFTLLAYLSNPARVEVGPADIFCNWDCDWYTGIADNGYVLKPGADKHGVANWAFFPALPALMWALSRLSGLSSAYSGLLIANVAWALGLYGIFLLARDLAGPRFARHVAGIYALWPFAIHASVPMTEAIFVPLCIAVMLFARRGDWLLAGLAAAALSGSRTVGIMIVLPMLLLAVRQYGLWRLATLRPGTERAVLALAMSGVGLGLYMIHLHGLMGDALAFSHNQAGWNRTFKLPWMMLIDELNPAFVAPVWLLANVCNSVTGLLALALVPTLWRRGLWPEALFAGLSLLIAFDTGSANSLPRYAGGLFPFMMAIALLTDRPLLRWPALAACACGQGMLTYAWDMEQFYVM